MSAERGIGGRWTHVMYGDIGNHISLSLTPYRDQWHRPSSNSAYPPLEQGVTCIVSAETGTHPLDPCSGWSATSPRLLLLLPIYEGAR